MDLDEEEKEVMDAEGVSIREADEVDESPDDSEAGLGEEL